MAKNIHLIRLFALVIGSLLILSVLGCGSEDLSPRAISPEVDVCPICNMSIVHEEYAAQAILANKEKLIFDDLGCLIQYALDGPESEIKIHYIKEYETNEWIDLSQAHYVYHADFWTPMNYGVLAFASQEKAEEFIQLEGKGQLLSPDDLSEHRWGIH